MYREKCEFPRNLIKDIIENIADKKFADLCSIKYACEHFNENVKRKFKGICDDWRKLTLDFYKKSNLDEAVFAEKYNVSVPQLHKEVAETIRVFSSPDNFPYFFMNEDFVETSNRLQDHFIEMNAEYAERNAILHAKIELVKKEVEMLSVREPRVRMENFKLITSKEKIDILDIKDKTKVKLRVNKIEFINQLILKTEDEILNITGLSEREAYDVMRALGKLGYDIK